MHTATSASQFTSRWQSISLDDKKAFTELTVICAVAGEWGKPQSHPESSEPVTKGRNKEIKTG